MIPKLYSRGVVHFCDFRINCLIEISHWNNCINLHVGSSKDPKNVYAWTCLTSGKQNMSHAKKLRYENGCCYICWLNNSVHIRIRNSAKFQVLFYICLLLLLLFCNALSFYMFSELGIQPSFKYCSTFVSCFCFLFFVMLCHFYMFFT